MSNFIDPTDAELADPAARLDPLPYVIEEKEESMENDWVYIAHCECGCGNIVMAVVDSPDHKKATAKEIAFCIKAGCAIERVRVEYVRKSRFGCEKKRALEEAKKAQQSLIAAV